jgi:hypothetical protein
MSGLGVDLRRALMRAGRDPPGRSRRAHARASSPRIRRQVEEDTRRAS